MKTGIALLYLTAVVFSGETTQAQDVKQIDIIAERFAFTPSHIKVKQGTVVEFILRSEDTNHGFRIPDAEINVVIPKRGRGVARVTFRAEKKGRYEFFCSKPCGAGHNLMRGVIIVN